MAAGPYDHDVHVKASQGRHLVRPRLHPGMAATIAHPRRGLAAFAVPPPIGELHNGSPIDVLLQGVPLHQLQIGPHVVVRDPRRQCSGERVP